MQLRDLSPSQRPSYRVTNHLDYCNLRELLAAIIGGDDQLIIADAVIMKFDDVQRLYNATTFELTQIVGIGEVIAVRIKAAFALGKKMLEPQQLKPSISNPEELAELVLPILSNVEDERFLVLCFNVRNRLLDISEVVHGSVGSASIRVAEVFKTAIRLNASAIALAHNHPSGSTSPSGDDISITNKIVEIGRELEISIIDHLVVGNGRYVSLKRMNVGGL